MNRFNPSAWGVYYAGKLVYLSMTPVNAREFAYRKNKEPHRGIHKFQVAAIPLEMEIE